MIRDSAGFSVGVPGWAGGACVGTGGSCHSQGLPCGEQSPRVLRAVVVLCVAKGPAQGFVAEKARNHPMGPV